VGSRHAASRIAVLVLMVFTWTMPVSLLSPGVVAAAGPALDWPMYLGNSSLTAASTETILTPSAAPTLRPLWTYKTGSVIAASATVVSGVAYVGSWDGYEYALNAATGALIWKTYLGVTTAPACSPPALGISSVPAVVGGVVYVGGGDSNWYALDATTGAVLWSVPTGDNSATGGHYNWSSPLIVGNSAYIGIASLGDCPLVQGQLLRVDLTTHTVAASVNFVPTGQVGGGVWTTPSIDNATNTVYVTTGTLNQESQTTSEAMVAVDATTLAIKSYWQIPRSAANADSDWGDSPILYTDGNNRAMVAGMNKNGFLYAFDRSNLALGPIWSDQIAIGGICPTCGDASVSSMAFANGVLYAAGGNTTIGGAGYQGSIRAINPTTGAYVWERGLASPVIPALAYDNGMLLAGVGPRLEVFDAATGNRLFSYATGAVTYAPPSISDGVIYIGSGDTKEYAFAATTPVTPPADSFCPSGFVCQDIGAPTPPGAESVTGGSWTISAGGNGVGATSDSIRLMSQTWTGSFGAQLRVASGSVAGAATETGLMARQANDASSPFYAVSVAGGNSISVQYRTGFGVATKTVAGGAAVRPIYLEIVRNGDTFAAATSPDGLTYTLVAGSTVTDVMPDQLLVGTFATSGLSGTATASTVDSVALGAPGTPPGAPASASPCPSGWTCTDVGNVPVVGNQSLAAGTWSISGSGTASGNNIYADQFHMVSQPIGGDATLSARVAAQPNTSASAQAGLVFRADSSSTGAVSYGAFLTPTNGLQVVYRTASGLRTSVATTLTGAAPLYLEITRYQNTYTAFTSPDGVNWSVVVGSSVTFGGFGSMVAGLAVNSNTTAAVSDTFDSVALAASAAPPPSLCPTGWTCQDIGFPTPQAGSQYVVGANTTVTAGGSDIWGSYDTFRLLSQPLTADGTMSVRVDSQTNTNAWAKTGVMLRATNDPASPYYAEFVTPGNGIAVQWRATQGAATSQVAIAGSVPAWLQVARSGGTFTAYTSPDGVNWTAIPGSSVGLTMTGTLLAGLAATSHNGGQMGAVTFDTATLTNSSSTPPGACPTAWTCADIGNVGIAGAQSLTSGTWTVQGGGGDIWDVSDNFHYVWQSLATDGGVSTRAVAQTSTDLWAKAGPMLRATTDPGSVYYAAFMTPGHGIVIQWRSAQGGTTSQALLAGATPVYLRVGRVGGTYSAYTSPDGAAWTLVPGSGVNLGLTGPVLAGLAITSHNWGVLGTGTFDAFAFQSLPFGWSDTDIGAPALAGSAGEIGGVYTIKAGGADIYGTSDQLNYASTPTIGDSILSARVATQANTSSWAKTGVMFRATTDPGSPNYFAFVTPGNGVAVQWRKTLGGATSQVKTTGTVPVYLQIIRTGNTFNAYRSPDGSAWTLIPGSTVTLTFPTTYLAGLASTSHNTSKLGTVTFDSFGLGVSAGGNDFSIAANPATASVVAGTAGSTAVSTVLIAGSAESIALSTTGLPAGVTAGFAPAAVTAGGSSTLTFNVGASAAPGTYPITVTGTAASATHSTPVSLTITAPASNDFSISATPAAVSAAAGGAGSTSIGTALVSGTAETVVFSAGGLPSGVTASFSPTSVTAGAASTLTLNVGAAVAPGTYNLTVTGTATSATHATAVALTVTASSGLPSPWLDTDVGSPSPAGSAAYSGGIFTVNGSGADIFGTSDQFNYVYQPTTGNGTIIARVASQTNAGSANDKAGVMWKASTTAGSPYILIAANYQGLVKVQYNFSGSLTTTTYTYPNVWMKLVRSGSLFSAYLSPDGLTWTAVLTNKSLPTISTAATVGIFECSHVAGKLGTATLDNVGFTPGP
jgi:outer membrane protein assembly factor BamB